VGQVVQDVPGALGPTGTKGSRAADNQDNSSTHEDGAATESILMDEWVQELCVAQEEARKLILANIKSEQQDRVESSPHRSQTWKAGDQVMLRADRKGKGQSKASRSSVTMDGVWNPENTADGVQAGRGR